MSESSRILNDERAAEILGTTARRVRSWVRRRILPGNVLPDGNVAIILADLVGWIQKGPSEIGKEVVHE